LKLVIKFNSKFAPHEYMQAMTSFYLYLYIFKNYKLYNLLTLETDPDNIL